MTFAVIQLLLIASLVWVWATLYIDGCLLYIPLMLLILLVINLPQLLGRQKICKRIILKGLKSRYWIQRWDAIFAINHFDLRDESVISVLNTALRDMDKRVRRIAARVLDSIEETKKVIPRLIERLDHINPMKRAATSMKLAEIGFDAALALPKLKELAQTDSDLTVRNHAKRAIAKIEPLPYEKLVELLDDPNWLERKYAAEALGYIGQKAVAQLPALREMSTTDDSRQVRDVAMRTIGRLENLAAEGN